MPDKKIDKQTSEVIVTHPATRRNSEPLFAVLEGVLATLRSSRTDIEQRPLSVLELASGGGFHIELFASRESDVVWQPSEPEPVMRASIDARIAQAQLANLRPALALDVRETWPDETFDLVLATNMVHISPWAATQALVVGAADVLAPAGLLLLYGPYRRNGQHTSQGNAEFDIDLRQRNPQWGIRDVEDVEAQANAAGFTLMRVKPMPANNFCLLFARG